MKKKVCSWLLTHEFMLSIIRFFICIRKSSSINGMEDWTNFDDGESDETFSFSDFPITNESDANGKEDDDGVEPELFHEFEFFKDEEKMCAADEVFFRGKMIVPSMNNGRVCSGSRNESSKGFGISQKSSTRESTHAFDFYFTHPSPKPYLPSKQPRRTQQARQHLQAPTVGNFRFGMEKNRRRKDGKNNGMGHWRNRFGCRWCSADDEPIEPRRKEKQQMQVFSPIQSRNHGDKNHLLFKESI